MARPDPSVLVDPLTGIGSRRALRDALEVVVTSGRPGALALIEVDGFEALSVRRSSAHVDRLLRHLGAQLDELEPGRCFRLGEGRFAVVLTTAGDLVGWGEDLRDELGRISAELTVSVGTARVERGIDVAGLHARVAVALRAAQRRGSGSYADYAAQGETAPDGVTPEKAQALYDVLSAGSLRVHYQPIVDLWTGRTIAFEALARPQATSGLSGPLEAFEVAAKLGLTPELDAVCRDSIFAEGPGFELPRGARLHVNVSPLSLGHRSLSAPVLRRQLSAAGIHPRQLVLELTREVEVETTVVERELQRLRQAGHILLLDDVGSTSAGLRRLGTGHFHALKIAGDVLAATATSAHAVGIVEAICAFARHTDTRVIAGGIETAELLAFVQRFRPSGHPDWRIGAAQGFWLGRPTLHARPAELVPSVDEPAS